MENIGMEFRNLYITIKQNPYIMKYTYKVHLNKHLTILFIMVSLAMNFTHLRAVSIQSADSLEFISVRGFIISSEDQEPVVFASVFMDSLNIGTVSNSEGIFLFKVPVPYKHLPIVVSSLGFKKKHIYLSDLAGKLNTIILEPAIIPIEEVTIKRIDPLALVELAVKNIPVNYSQDPVAMTGFYREAIKKNRNYISVGEAVLDIYKASYKKLSDLDRIQINKGRKSQNIHKHDTIIMKFQGGPLLISSLDMVKNPGIILSREDFQFYNYTLNGIVDVGGRDTYLVRFSSKKSSPDHTHEGNIYIDIETYAIVNLEIEVSDDKMEEATEVLIRKKPAGFDIRLQDAKYLVTYRMIENIWYISYVRVELSFRCKWKKKLFASSFMIVSEAVITDMDPADVIKPRARESLKKTSIFSEEVSNFEDPGYWGASNVIEPESSIQEAISKINRKLNKKDQRK